MEALLAGEPLVRDYGSFFSLSALGTFFGLYIENIGVLETAVRGIFVKGEAWVSVNAYLLMMYVSWGNQSSSLWF